MLCNIFPKYDVRHKHVHSKENDYNPEIIDLFVSESMTLP